MKIVHILPHLGGGVGTALESLIKYDDSYVKRTIILLEKPIEKKNIYKLKSKNVNFLNFDIQNLPKKLIEAFDIIHIDWWSHPLQFLLLKKLSNIKSRFLFWIHISGISNPLIPQKLYQLGIPVIFSSDCSIDSKTEKILKYYGCDYTTIKSNGDLSYIKKKSPKENQFKLAYIGSQNFSKLHPHILKTIAQLPDEYKPISFFGNTLLKNEVKKLRLQNDIIFKGFKENLHEYYDDIDILIYLLNPLHYGTSENSLLEAMSAGIIPIVLNNKCEKIIVKNNYSGIVIREISELKHALDKLINSYALRVKLSKNCSNYVKLNFDIKTTSLKFKNIYSSLIKKNKFKKNFNLYFSEKSSDWFKSVNTFENDNYNYSKKDLFFLKFFFKEKTKSNITHFETYFPHDKDLKIISNKIKKMFY